jgi:hypothetical protein
MQSSCAILPYVACPALLNYSTLSHKRQDFRKIKIQNKTCVLVPSTSVSETFLILKRTERDMIAMYIGPHVQYPFFIREKKQQDAHFFLNNLIEINH